MTHLHTAALSRPVLTRAVIRDVWVEARFLAYAGTEPLSKGRGGSRVVELEGFFCSPIGSHLVYKIYMLLI